MANSWRTHGVKLLSAGSVMIALLSSLLVGLLTAPIVSAHAAQRTAKTSSTSASCLQPPANVDLTTLSDAQLAVYGLPARARYQGRLAYWKKLIQHAKHRYCGPLVKLNKQFSHETLHRPYTREIDNDTWAGNIAIDHSYNEVESTWNVPCVSTSSYRPAEVYQWVGLGGDGADYSNQGTDYHTLEQAGTGSGINTDGSTYYFAWFEDVPYDAYAIPTTNYSSRYVTYCADSMYVYLDSNLSYSRKVYYYIEDVTQDWYFPHQEGSGSYSWLTDGSSAEWIVERPGTVPTALADFSLTEAYFGSAQTLRSGASLYVGQTTHNYANMYNYDSCSRADCGTELAYPGPIINGGQDFYVYFVSSY